jgi:hypothetical protein
MAQPVACAPVGTSGELLVPSTVSQSVEVVQGLLTLKEFLDEAELKRVEQVLVECAKEADFKINEQEYGRGNHPDDAECNRIVRYDANQQPIRRAMELGTMKHLAAFACLQRELGPDFSDHLSLEPRYGKDPSTGAYALTEEWMESLVPDVVLHAAGDANGIQLLYDFLFPCTVRSKSDPLGFRGQTLSRKLEKYRVLPGKPQGALVTPQLGVSR